LGERIKEREGKGGEEKGGKDRWGRKNFVEMLLK